MLKLLRTMLSVVIAAAMTTAASAQAAQPPAKPLRVGTYDPRAVAVAWAASSQHNAELKEKMAQREKAKQAGDQQTVADLEAWGKAQQHKLHLQGFSAAPVDDILKKVKDRLPGVARQAGVDVIVGRADYVSDESAVVDVTDELIKVFEPSEKTLKTVQELRKTKPIPADVIEAEEKKGKI